MIPCFAVGGPRVCMIPLLVASVDSPHAGWLVVWYRTNSTIVLGNGPAPTSVDPCRVVGLGGLLFL